MKQKNQTDIVFSGRANMIRHDKILETLLSRYSSWDSLRKTIAWLLRYKKYLVGSVTKDPERVIKGPLTVAGVKAAESVIVKAVQQDMFPAELVVANQIVSGNQKKCFPRSSPIRNLNPFLPEGIVRVGGRFENAPVSFETKHPVILLAKHHVTNLIIQNCHRLQGHSGPSQVLVCI